MRNFIPYVASVCTLASTVFGFSTSEPAYLVAPASGDFDFTPLVTVGDYVDLTAGDPGDTYAFVGIPDAMGIYQDPVTSENILFVAHELTSGVTSEPLKGATQFKGAFVSRFVLDNSAAIVSGGVAHGDLYLGNTYVASTPPQAGDTNAFTRFCSGSFAGVAEGMDRPFFFTNEESGSGTYEDANGPQTVAIYDGAMHTVPALGRLARETTRVMPRRDKYMALISTEDDGTPSYIYMYVGTKLRRADSVLEKNGLDGGKIYVLSGAGSDAGADNTTFSSGTISTDWIEISGAASMNASALKTAAGLAGGYAFVRVEDAEFDPLEPTRSMFVGATGGSGSNTLGRLYKVNFNPRNPALPGTMEIIYNADEIVKPGGDINAGTDFAVSIDNIAVTANYIVVCEDRNSPADAVFAKYARNGGVWTLDRNNGYAAKYQGDFNFAYTNTRDSVSRSAGLWESSGVIDVSSIYGPDTFLINVQAHGTDRTNIANPDGGTYNSSQADDLFAEDGQVLLMRPKA